MLVVARGTCSSSLWRSGFEGGFVNRESAKEVIMFSQGVSNSVSERNIYEPPLWQALKPNRMSR